MKKAEIRRIGLKDEVIRVHFAKPDATISDIASELSVSAAYVRSTFRRNGLTAAKRAEKSSGPTIGTPSLLSRYVKSLLRYDANKRGVSVEKLASMIIFVVAKDKMVNAILDDLEAA